MPGPARSCWCRAARRTTSRIEVRFCRASSISPYPAALKPTCQPSASGSWRIRPDASMPNGILDIRVDDLRGPEIRALLSEHLRNMYEITPPGSVHALDLDALR